MTSGGDYKLYFLDDNGRFCGVDELNAVSDEAALDAARRKLTASQFTRAELWQLARRVGLLDGQMGTATAAPAGGSGSQGRGGGEPR